MIFYSSRLLFFFPLCSSGISIIWDKKQGTMERARVAGVKTWEILASFFMTEGTILLLQCALGLFVISTLFGIQVHGSLPLAFALCFLVGLAGISFGNLVVFISYLFGTKRINNDIIERLFT
jgi:ABC-type multidrug transport system permease subunit